MRTFHRPAIPVSSAAVRDKQKPRQRARSERSLSTFAATVDFGHAGFRARSTVRERGETSPGIRQVIAATVGLFPLKLDFISPMILIRSRALGGPSLFSGYPRNLGWAPPPRRRADNGSERTAPPLYIITARSDRTDDAWAWSGLKDR
jgi:hypothetical protein